jgi:hypothetical protein
MIAWVLQGTLSRTVDLVQMYQSMDLKWRGAAMKFLQRVDRHH